MRTKGEILNDLYDHAKMLNPQHYELAAVAMIETEVQIDIRDIFEGLRLHLAKLIKDSKEKD